MSRISLSIDHLINICQNHISIGRDINGFYHYVALFRVIQFIIERKERCF